MKFLMSEEKKIKYLTQIVKLWDCKQNKGIIKYEKQHRIKNKLCLNK